MERVRRDPRDFRRPNRLLSTPVTPGKAGAKDCSPGSGPGKPGGCCRYCRTRNHRRGLQLGVRFEFVVMKCHAKASKAGSYERSFQEGQRDQSWVLGRKLRRPGSGLSQGGL